MAPKETVTLALITPSADRISGSMLRPLNIWASIRGLKSLNIIVIPVRSIIHIFPWLKKVIQFDIVLISGVNPWILAIITLIRRIFMKSTIVDVHGFAWLEASMFGSNILYRTILLISEKLGYTKANHLIVASPWLAKTLREYFKVRNVHVIENAVSYIFESAVNRIRKLSIDPLLIIRSDELRNVISEARSRNKSILLSALPDAFRANILAYQTLLSIVNALSNEALIIVTGFAKPTKFAKLDNVVHAGYLTWVEYIAILLISDAVILLYPNNAICGGARNKVLEAGYCKKPVIATSIGVMHLPLSPMRHYIPLDMFKQSIRRSEAWYKIALEFNELVLAHYNFNTFRTNFIKLIISLIQQELMRIKI